MTPSTRPLVTAVPLREPHLPEEIPVLSVIVPVTERPFPLDRLYREYEPVLRARGVPFEFIVIVDRWRRGLADALQPLMEAGEPIRVLEVGQSVGESGMLEGARPHLRGSVVLTLPAYPRVLPEALNVLIDRVETGGAELATALRVSGGESWVSRLQRGVFHALLRAGSGVSFRDVASGVRVMRRTVLDEVPVYGDLFRFLPVLAEREGFRVEEVAVAQHPDDTAARVYSPGIYIRRLIDLLGLFFLVRFTRKPLRFFGLIGTGLAGVGGLILTYLLIIRIQGNAIADRPLLLLGVLLFVTGVQAVAMGLIGEIIVHLNAGGHRPEYRVRDEEP